VVGEEIVLDEDKAELYNIQATTDVEFALERLDEDDPESAVAFAERYGLLWHGAGELGTGECRERLDDWWRVSREMFVVINLYRALRRAVQLGSTWPIGAADFDYESIKWPHDGLLSSGWPREVADTVEGQVRLAKTGEWEGEEQVLSNFCMLLAELINAGLKGCGGGLLSLTSPYPKSSQPGAFRFDAAPPNVEVRAYANLATTFAKGAEIKKCPGCRRLFTADSVRQEYHNESCASTSRWRRWKERQSE
jgi:hypothetical protein